MNNYFFVLAPYRYDFNSLSVLCTLRTYPLFVVLVTSHKDSEKTFLCNCGRKYKHYSSLYTHQKYECGKAPGFQCTYCQAAYKHKHRLKEHVATKHGFVHTNTPN